MMSLILNNEAFIRTQFAARLVSTETIEPKPEQQRPIAIVNSNNKASNKDRHSALIEQIAQDQCADSFKELFNDFAPKIFSFAMSHQLGEAKSKDLVQEVMAVVWTKAHLYSVEKGKAATWIFTIARNQRFDLLRKNVREEKVISSESIWDTNSSTDIIDQDANLEKFLERKEIAQHVDNLPELQKKVIQEIYFSGLTQDEFAKKYNVPLGTVKSRVRLAIRKLNNLLRSS